MKEKNLVTEADILKAKGRDLEAFERIYHEFKDFVWNVTLKMAGSPTLAEDITSEVFIRLFKKIKKFQFKSSFKTWFYRLTVNTALNYLDKESRRRTKQLNEDSGYLNKVFNADDEFDNKIIMDILLNRLDDRQRMLIVLREVEGLSYNEITDVLDMNLGTVKTNIYRARDRLKEIYKEVINNEV